MDSDLRAMWGFLVLGTFSLITICLHSMNNIAAGGTAANVTIFVLLISVAFSCAMFVMAFIAAVNYLKVQLRHKS